MTTPQSGDSKREDPAKAVATVTKTGPDLAKMTKWLQKHKDHHNTIKAILEDESKIPEMQEIFRFLNKMDSEARRKIHELLKLF